MMVAKSRAPNSRMVYKIQSCPSIAAVERIMTSPMTEGCRPTNSNAWEMELSLRSQNNEIVALHRFTQTI